MSEPKLTAEELLTIADDAAKEMLDAFIPAYSEAARKVLRAVVRAKAENMPEEQAVVALKQFLDRVDLMGPAIEAALDKVGKEEGVDEL